MDHVYEYESCAPLPSGVTVVDKWRRFHDGIVKREGNHYLISYEEFVEQFDNGNYRHCTHRVEWLLVNTYETTSNSREDYSETTAIDGSILTTDTNPPWEHI